MAVLQPRLMLCNTAGLGYCAFARHYLRNHFCFLFLRVMRCFSSPGLPYALHSTDIAVSGLPHSDIRGSMCICHSPRLFAAYHVLLRLQEPRHPSCALFSFLFSFAFWYYSYILWVKSLYTLAFVSLHCWNSTLCLDFLLFFSCFQYVNVLFLNVVPGRVELPTSTLSV